MRLTSVQNPTDQTTTERGVQNSGGDLKNSKSGGGDLKNGKSGGGDLKSCGGDLSIPLQIGLRHNCSSLYRPQVCYNL